MKRGFLIKSALIAAAGLMVVSMAGCNKPTENTTATAANTVSADNSSNTMAPTNDTSNPVGAGSQKGGGPY